MAALERDQAKIREHLELLVAPAVGTALSDGLLEIAYGKAEPNKAHLFRLSEIHLAVEFATRMNRIPNQVYVGMAVRRPGCPISKRTTKRAFYGSHFAWLDDAADWQAARAAWNDCPPDLIVWHDPGMAWPGCLALPQADHRP
jgi:hypothetical protein